MSTIDLHDLVTILLRERILTEPRFKHAYQREINDGSVPRKFLSDTPLPILDNFPKDILHLAFFMIEDDTKDPEIMDPTRVQYTGGDPISAMQSETFFWAVRHHDSGYELAYAMQLPATTKLRIRTSQGRILTVPPTSFSILSWRASTPTFANLK